MFEGPNENYFVFNVSSNAQPLASGLAGSRDVASYVEYVNVALLQPGQANEN
jgi:hypothetical protein